MKKGDITLHWGHRPHYMPRGYAAYGLQCTCSNVPHSIPPTLPARPMEWLM